MTVDMLTKPLEKLKLATFKFLSALKKMKEYSKRRLTKRVVSDLAVLGLVETFG